MLLAIEQVGECVGVRWQPTGSRGYRRATIYFRYRNAALGAEQERDVQ
ncbi:MAG: hypothetical protein H7Y32_04130 [Chloroflexales bacterium]|nr:hypothetical protein [Chloroflexales bacterium]